MLIQAKRRTSLLKSGEPAIIDTDVFVANAKKFGTFCAANPNISVVNAAEKILGK
jgi:acid stress chaperone HdeB